jgi:hypothetical protein
MAAMVFREQEASLMPTTMPLRAPDTRREKFTVPIRCACGQVGSTLWEENAVASPQGPQAIRLAVSAGFYERAPENSAVPADIICAVCEAVVPD